MEAVFGKQPYNFHHMSLAAPASGVPVSIAVQTSRSNTLLPAITTESKSPQMSSAAPPSGVPVSIAVQTSRSNTPLPAITTESRPAIKFENTGLVTEIPLPPITRIEPVITRTELARARTELVVTGNDPVKTSIVCRKFQTNGIVIDTGQDYITDNTDTEPMKARKSGNISVELVKLAHARKGVKGNVNSNLRSINIDCLTPRVVPTPVSNQYFSPRDGDESVKNDETFDSNINQTLNPDTELNEMNAKAMEAFSSSVPIIKVQQNAIPNRGNRRLHGIAQLNAMRNKHVSFNQHRIAKRKETKENSGKNNLLKSFNHLAIGDLDICPQPPPSNRRPLTVWGKSPNSDITRSSAKSGDTRPSPQLSMSRSKTFSGLMSKGTVTPSNRDTAEEEGGSGYEIKGSSLQKEANPVNPNTPQPDDDINQYRAKSPLISRYANGVSPIHDKLPGLSLSVDQSNGTNMKLHSMPKRFKPKRDNTKLVLKYYSEGVSRKSTNGFLSVDNNNNPNHIRGIMASPTKSMDGSQNDRKVSFKVGESEVSVANSGIITNGYSDNQPSNRPVSLTTQNLELFDQMSSINLNTQSSISLSEDEQIINERLLSWIKDRQKVLEPVEDEENVQDLNEKQLFSGNMYRHPVQAYQY